MYWCDRAVGFDFPREPQRGERDAFPNLHFWLGLERGKGGYFEECGTQVVWFGLVLRPGLKT